MPSPQKKTWSKNPTKACSKITDIKPQPTI